MKYFVFRYHPDNGTPEFAGVFRAGNKGTAAKRAAKAAETPGIYVPVSEAQWQPQQVGPEPVTIDRMVVKPVDVPAPPTEPEVPTDD